MKVCSCGKRAIARGLCTNCYAQWRRTGGVHRRICKTEGCGKYATSRGFCPGCYWRSYQHGTTQLTPKPKSRRLTITPPVYAIEQAMGLLEENESLSAFVAAGMLGEIARRRALKRVA